MILWALGTGQSALNCIYETMGSTLRSMIYGESSLIERCSVVSIDLEDEECDGRRVDFKAM